MAKEVKRGTFIVLNLAVILVLSALVLTVPLGFAEYRWTGAEKPLQYDENSRISISRDTLDYLNKYFSGLDTEFSACLAVEQHLKFSDDGKYLHTEFEITGIKDYSVSDGINNANHNYCEYALLHSHPNNSCFFSLADIHSIKDRFRKGEFFSVLMCGQDELYYITRNDFTESKVKIN